MRACKRCGFLNPDKAEFCIKCRLDMRSEEKEAGVPLIGNPLNGSAVGKVASRGPVPDEPRLGVGPVDEPPSWAQKPELIAPMPDLDDTFAGRGQDLGGYQAGGIAEGHQPQGPAVSDAFTIMTSSSALAGSGEVPDSRKKSGRSKGAPKVRKQKDSPPPAPVVPGAILGLPPDLGSASFQIGMQEEDYRPQPGGPVAGGRPGMTPRRQATPPQAPQQQPPPQPRQPVAHQAAPQVGMQSPSWPAPAGEPLPPLGPPPGQQPQAPVKRPIPRQVPVVPLPGKAQKAPRDRPAISMPDLGFLRKAGELATPRVIVTIFAGILVLFAVVYLLVGGNYFSSDAQGLVEGAQKSMAGLSSVHVQADILMQTEKVGTINTTVSADVAKDRDFRVSYQETSFRPALEYVTAAGKTYKKTGAGAWEVSTDAVNPDLSSTALFNGTSGSRLIDRQTIDGVECDHIAFESGAAYARSFFPGVDVTEATRVDVEVWVDRQQKYVRHVRLDARNLESVRLGRFDCHVEAAFSGFGAPLEIKPPV
ncbi:MAG: LolA-like protein [Candidatus Geothermincolia bacterium]